MLYHILFEKWIGEGRKDQVKGNHVRRNRKCIKASLDFSKEIILVKYL
jgi:hypothetical protein